MDGVRRWITSGSPTTRKSAHVEPWHAPASKASKQEVKVDRNSTGYIAAALLDPVVPEEEELEYGAYVEQCDELSRAPPELAELARQAGAGRAAALPTSCDLAVW